MHSISPWTVLFLNTVQNLSFEFLVDRSLTTSEAASTTTVLFKKNTTMSHTSCYINWRWMPLITRGRAFWVLHCKQAILSEETGWTIPSVSNSRYLLHWQFPAEEIISFRGRNFCIRKSSQSLGSSITCGTEESVLTFRMVLCPSSLVTLPIYKYALVLQAPD